MTDDSAREVSRRKRLDLGRITASGLVLAADAADAAGAVAQRAGITKKNGEVSIAKVAWKARNPRRAIATLVKASADEIKSRRDAGSDQSGEVGG